MRPFSASETRAVPWLIALAVGALVGCSSSSSGSPTTTVQSCDTNADCASKVCNTGAHLCLAPTATDGALNEDETDIDCGGKIAKACDVDKKCLLGGDCTTGVCKDTGGGLTCQTPTSTDGVKNGNETGVDCGNTGNPTCANGHGCTVRADCTNLYCKAGTCTAPAPADGVKNGTETDVDCGGTSGKTCAVTKACLAGTDCTSGACAYNDKCADKPSCTAHYGGDTCGLGGDGSVGTASYESCCATADVTVNGTTTSLGKYQVTAGRMRTFLTAVNGNVRGFVQGLRTANKIPFIHGSTTTLLLPAVWDPYLSTSMKGDDTETPDCDNGGYDYTAKSCYANPTPDQKPYAPIYTAANNHVGPTIFKANSQLTVHGCNYGGPGVHMYYLGSPDYFGETAEYKQEIYDQKSMQCVDWLTAEAFCLWDGGNLETIDEWSAAWGSLAMPWAATPTAKSQGFSTYSACRFPTASDAELRSTNVTGCTTTLIPSATQSIEYAAYEGSYEWPALISNSNDYSAYIAPPGRTRGRSAAGHADIVGNLLEMTANITYNASPFTAIAKWAANGSWEIHNYNARAVYGSYALMDKYVKQGVRCSYAK